MLSDPKESCPPVCACVPIRSSHSAHSVLMTEVCSSGYSGSNKVCRAAIRLVQLLVNPWELDWVPGHLKAMFQCQGDSH